MKRVVGCFVCGVLVLLLTGANCVGAGRLDRSNQRDRQRCERWRTAGRRRDRHADRYGTQAKRDQRGRRRATRSRTSRPVPYKLEAMLQGFRTFAQTGIVLQVGASPIINVTMAIGQVAETVTVTGSTPVVETRNLGVGQVMDNKRILELPLNGRNTADLLAVLPAAVPQPALNATSRSMGGSSGGIAYSLAGGVSFGVSFVLDGATHNNPYDNLNLPLPFPDALQEFKAETSAPDGAERHAFRRRGQCRDQVGHQLASGETASSSSGITASTRWIRLPRRTRTATQGRRAEAQSVTAARSAVRS